MITGRRLQRSLSSGGRGFASFHVESLLDARQPPRPPQVHARPRTTRPAGVPVGSPSFKASLPDISDAGGVAYRIGFAYVE